MIRDAIALLSLFAGWFLVWMATPADAAALPDKTQPDFFDGFAAGVSFCVLTYLAFRAAAVLARRANRVKQPDEYQNSANWGSH